MRFARFTKNAAPETAGALHTAGEAQPQWRGLAESSRTAARQRDDAFFADRVPLPPPFPGVIAALERKAASASGSPRIASFVCAAK